MERTLTIYVLGRIWQGLESSAVLNVTVGEGLFQVQFGDPTNLDEVWQYVDTHTGDFACVDAIEATYQEVTSTVIEKTTEGNVLRTVEQTETRTVHIAEFTQDENDRYCDTL